MASTNLKYTCNEGNNPWNIWAEVTELTTSGTTREIQLAIYVQASDYQYGRSGYYSVKCSEANVNTGQVSHDIPGSSQSALEILNETFDVTVDDNGKASVDVSFTAGFYSQSYGGYRTASGSLTEVYLESGDSPGGEGGSEYTWRFYYTEGSGTSLKVKRTWNETDADDVGYISNGTVIAWKDYFDVTFGALTGYQDAKVEHVNFNITKTTKNDDGTTTYRGTMSTDGNIRVTSSAVPNAYTLSIPNIVGASITVRRISTNHNSASINVTLTNGDTIYHDDQLEITCSIDTGYNLSSLKAGDTEITSGAIYTVSGETTIAATIEVQSYTLTLNPDTGSTITVTRTSSPLQEATRGDLSNGETIYYNDVLQISFVPDAGYEIQSHLVNQMPFVSGESHTVIGDVEIVTITGLCGIAYIYDGISFVKYIVYIYNGSTWDQYIPYIYNGTNWVICG